MAKRPSVKEILEAARKGGPAKPDEGSREAEAPVEPEAVSASSVTPEAPAPAREVPPANAPTPASLGRPLTLKEKLAAARAGGAAAPAGSSTPKTAAATQAESTSEQASPSEAAEPASRTVAAPTPSIGRPLTLKEKLAAARGGAASPGASTDSQPAAAPKPAGAAPKPAVARTLPPLEKITDPKDLAEAMRQSGEKKAKEAAAKAKAAEGDSPKKPARERETKPQTILPRPSRLLARFATPRAATDPTISRRGFFLGSIFVSWIFVGWAAFTAGCLQFTAMLARFMFPNVLAEPPSTIKVGLPSNFEPEEVNERFKAEWGFWIVRSTRYNGQDIVYALQSVCTHLGCPPNWLGGEQKFKCPCHGSGFYISGVNFEGPAPRPLERFKVSLSDDGQMVVDKSQKFQQELGQWSDPDSFLTA